MGHTRTLQFCPLAVSVEYDSLDRHIAAAGDIAHASVPMGMLLAWCVNMQLLDASTLAEHERLVLRLRFEEASGSELLVACGGALHSDLFNPEGQRFMAGFYPRYMDVFRAVFGDDIYAVRDNWDNYQKLAKVLTAEYMGPPPQPKTSVLAKLSAWLKR